MTIVFDAERRRSTHVESGLAVEWVREDPPLERCTHFKLIVNGTEKLFGGSYNHGEDNILREFPGISGEDLYRKMNELNEINYSASGIDLYFDRETFVSVWNDLVSKICYERRATTSYIEYVNQDPDNERRWSAINER